MSNDLSRKTFYKDNEAFWNSIAAKNFGGWAQYYHGYLQRVYRFIIPENSRILEIGCGTGNLLAALNPRYGLGIDLSVGMINEARDRHPHLSFKCGAAEDLDLEGPYDYIILSDTLNFIWDIQELLSHISTACDSSTRVVINAYSRLWQPMLNTVRALGLATPNRTQSWLTVEDIKNLLALEGFDTVKTSGEIIFPLNIPYIKTIANRYLAKIFPFRHLCLSNFIVARKLPKKTETEEGKTVSVIVAARNEEGNIADIFKRTPDIGKETELIFVEGGSSDNTLAAIQAEIEKHPEKNAHVYQQTGTGKGDAVRLGFEKATGDILVILDADMTVPPENLPLFYKALIESKGEFINGVRLIYPMEGEAMRFCNLIGNKFFSLAFSWLLDQSIKDTLCGTKMLTKQNYNIIAANRYYFGDFDPFGDFDLIFGAAKQNLKIVDLPIRYRNRLYGETNISRWKHGIILLKMVFFAANKIKFF